MINEGSGKRMGIMHHIIYHMAHGLAYFTYSDPFCARVIKSMIVVSFGIGGLSIDLASSLLKLSERN